MNQAIAAGSLGVIFLGVLILIEWQRRSANRKLSEEMKARRLLEDQNAKYREEANALQTTVDNQARRMRELVDDTHRILAGAHKDIQ